MPKKTRGMSYDTLQQIISKHDRDGLTLSKAYGSGGIDPLWPRFERAAVVQIGGGGASPSRYAIWANTVRENILVAMHHLDEGTDTVEAKRLLTRAANSLSAFSDVQAYFDPFELGHIE